MCLDPVLNPLCRGSLRLEGARGENGFSRVLGGRPRVEGSMGLKFAAVGFRPRGLQDLVVAPQAS